MHILAIILAVLDILVCLALVLLVVAQEGTDRGMGALMGAPSDTFYSKNANRSKDKRLKRYTFLLALIFVILTIVLYAIVSH